MSYPPGTDSLSAQLPFHIDDIEQVNNTFTIWKKYKRKRDKRIVDLWTYCYVRRYFAFKLLKNKLQDITDVDILVGKVFTKIIKTHDTVKFQDKYASWVSVICKNHFKNHLRAMRRYVPLIQEDYQTMQHLVQEPGFDLPFVYQVVQDAITRLPNYLQQVATMRFLEDKSYKEISSDTGKEVQVIRSYIHKAIHRLREDAILLQCIEQEDLTDTLDFLTSSK